MPSCVRSRSHPPRGSSLRAGCWSLYSRGCPKRPTASPSAAPFRSPKSPSTLAVWVSVRKGAYMTL
eukprot:14080479-Alexandrium_andersonii.AAC.1